jgi:autotransporter-associated beta strand protein
LGQLVAFPGALGYGAATTGARAGGSGLSVYQVTNLNNSGSGSFRDAVSASNRIIVFDVGGNIDISSPISAASNLTILGQTAPGQGIAIYGAETSFYGSSNDIVRYMRFMDTTLDPGGQGTGNSSGNCLNLGNTNNMIFDHVSCEFASYNNIDASGTTGANNLTFQNSIVADPIPDQQFNFHWQGSQGTFINNIFANSHNRSILAKGETQFVNNTVYDYQAGFTTGNSSGNFDFDIVNNYFISGPATTSANDGFYQVDGNQKAYASGNLLDGNNNGTLDGSSYNSTGATVSSTPLLTGTTSLPTQSATASYYWNIAHSGDSLTHNTSTYAPSLGYDEVDQNVINTVSSLGTSGRLYGSQSDDGITDGPTAGIGPVASGTIENANYSTALNPEGYTEVEAWANGMADSNLIPRIWTANGGEWNTTANWGTIVPYAIATPGFYDIAYVEGNGAGSDGLVTVATATPTCYQLDIGGNGGAAGEKVQVTSGNLNVMDTITVGYLNKATLELDGGKVQAANVQLGNTVGPTTYTGNLILNGGTLQTNQIVLGGGSPGSWTTGGSISFNGGAVQSTGTFNINAPASLGTNGATIDTNSNIGTISGIFSGSGTLTIKGGGTVNATGSSTYTGITRVTGATLAISTFATSGTVSPLGETSSSQGNIVLDGGTLEFFGGGTDHLFDLTASGGTINSSGSGQTSLTNTAILSPSAAANVTLTLSGTNGNHNDFSPTLADPAGGYQTSLTMAGTGLWDLEGNQKTYSGPTTILSGTLQTLGTNVMSPNSSVTVDSGAYLDFHAYNQTINALNGAGVVVNNFVTSTNTLTIGAANGSGTFSGLLGTGTLSIVKTGSGIQVLSGSNGYVGTTTVSGGVLQFNQASSIGSTGVTVTVNSGATVAAGYAIDQTDFLDRITTSSTGCAALAVNSANNLDFSSAGANLPSMSLGAVGSATFTGTLTPNGSTYLLGGGGGILTLPNANALTGSRSLQVSGPGTVALTTTNNYTGITTVSSGGVLQMSSFGNGGTASSIGSNSNAAANIVLDGGTLRYVGGGTGVDRAFTLTANGGTLDGSGSGGITYDSPNPVAFSNSGNTTLTLAGSESHSNFELTLGDPAGGQTSVVVNSASRWLWSTTASNYSGNTTIQSGELELYGGGEVPSGSGKGNVLVNTGGELWLTGNASINGLNNGNSGGGTVYGSSGNLTLGNGNAAGSFSGSITGSIGLVKTGTGLQTLSGSTITYSGTTTISAGTLSLNAAANPASAITNTSGIEVDGGAILQLVSSASPGGNLQMLPISAPISLYTTGGTPEVQLSVNQNTELTDIFEINGIVQPAGLYSSTTAPAGATADEAYFSGNGSLTVVPEPAAGSFIAGVCVSVLLRRRRRGNTRC